MKNVITNTNRIRKPIIKMDWDSNRRRVTNIWGEEFVLFKDNAERLYQANVRLYKKRKKFK